MDNKPEGKVIFTVKRAQLGQWEINESGFEKSIASFSDKNEAVEYAQRLAETKTLAEVRVQD